MLSNNSYNGLDPQAIKLIRYKANQLAEMPCFRAWDAEDVEQELAIASHLSESNFDADLSTKRTFLNKVIQNRCATMVNKASAPHRFPGDDSLSWETLTDLDREGAIGHVGSLEGPDAVELRLDFHHHYQRLPDMQKRLCNLLPYYGTHVLSKKMGCSKTTLYRHIADLRRSFCQFGFPKKTRPRGTISTRAEYISDKGVRHKKHTTQTGGQGHGSGN
ncbi:RNA polymerase, sigma-24 subunit, ECF subfamily [Magnetococcus marinus MC-1]|uniref:RNA polymerase, sigma-24 subunit, ECF subfamily n=1 Tax=Magnetococcus marinus (strain ATCC BAA-1437 / JCM 17883 / MC-1) TaxID=156889 RepID=A0LB11_MAGMM|nr:sigma-70 family RNA polymerase sigma factor [Magnetococcus marinus]ABK45154.1 RNA polymerase, sigma-24 subunit, ECF subfamily [Magnetococcus marinus MC-1]